MNKALLASLRSDPEWPEIVDEHGGEFMAIRSYERLIDWLERVMALLGEKGHTFSADTTRIAVICSCGVVFDEENDDWMKALETHAHEVINPECKCHLTRKAEA